MSEENILNEYIELINKGYCSDCNELNCIDNFPHKKIAKAIEQLQQENKLNKYILTEFEKWLEYTYNYVGSTDILEVIRKYDFIFGLENMDTMLKTIDFIKQKLQELKEGKNEKSND